MAAEGNVVSREELAIRKFLKTEWNGDRTIKTGELELKISNFQLREFEFQKQKRKNRNVREISSFPLVLSTSWFDQRKNFHRNFSANGTVIIMLY